MEDEKALRRLMDFMRLISVALLLLHLYYYCYAFFAGQGLRAGWLEELLTRLSTKTALFAAPAVSLGGALLFLLLSCLGTRGAPLDKPDWRATLGYGGVGGLLLAGAGALRELVSSPGVQTAVYALALGGGYLLLLRAALRVSRLLQLPGGLLGDLFNEQNESFPQQEQLVENEYSVNLRTQYTYRGKQRRGVINVVNPFRGTMVLGTPGSGKTYAVISEFIRQHLQKGFALYVYDFKFDDLTRQCYNELRRNAHRYAVQPRFYVINFDDPRKSHRCNPLLAEQMTDIVDAYEAAATIMLNLNKTWIQKQGDFFVESPINFVTAIIWFLKLYENGRYCTFPHVIELLSQSYEELFPILGAYSEIENYVRPFASALERDALEQLEGQIASARIPLSRLASPQLYWVMSGNDFTLDLNDPRAPKVLCVGNNPERQGIYGAALGLYNARLVKLINRKHRLKTALVIDELPTIYFKGLDTLLATARSNKVATCLGFQDFAQLERDYGKAEATVIRSTVGNVIAGQVVGESAEALSKRFGRILQRREGVSVNSREASRSTSTQLDSMLPAARIAGLTQGCFVGAVADNVGEEISQKVFHARIVVDEQARAREAREDEDLPHITNFTDPHSGRDRTEELVRANYERIKAEVREICRRELERIAADPTLQHLVKARKQRT
ncbi:conjugal transfer protein MobC [Hymenobacter latericus]|uniref:conjugal transfer protein MobC n=1 Tax=Hymenobacter sp. YIM 151858-1 TaxID=2987688 RepID=UPI00222781CD|nr:conjugal transfer protein MobC [Hymenobacter sp. YIM 151858-1]UYZ61218.1 YWFCY domain-containing protein [Hymenobacter sp. YIM 151858-1]